MHENISTFLPLSHPRAGSKRRKCSLTESFLCSEPRTLLWQTACRLRRCCIIKPREWKEEKMDLLGLGRNDDFASCFYLSLRRIFAGNPQGNLIAPFYSYVRTVPCTLDKEHGWKTKYPALYNLAYTVKFIHESFIEYHSLVWSTLFYWSEECAFKKLLCVVRLYFMQL